jgi:hypothetical protein
MIHDDARLALEWQIRKRRQRQSARARVAQPAGKFRVKGRQT